MTPDEPLPALRRALQQLPACEPPSAAWDQIRARLDAPPRRRTSAVAAGLGACALAALALWAASRPAVEPTAAGLRPAPAPPHQELERRSAELERLLAALPPGRVTRASTGLTAALLEDRIAVVDDHLSGPPVGELSPDATRALWRERVMLLDSLVRVRYAASVAQTL